MRAAFSCGQVGKLLVPFPIIKRQKIPDTRENHKSLKRTN